MSDVRRYEAHTCECGGKHCNGCAILSEDEDGSVVMFEDYKQRVAELESAIEESTRIITYVPQDVLKRWFSERVCLKCRKPINDPFDIYRCYDCDGSYHRECLKLHIGESDPRKYLCARAQDRKVAELEAKLAEAEKLNEELAMRLLELEWVDSDKLSESYFWFCPCCKRNRLDGHTEQCSLAKTLAEWRKAKEE